MMIKAVLFDLDNTLIDFMRMKKFSIDEAINAMMDAGLNFPKKKIVDETYRLYGKEGIEDKFIFQKLLKRLLGRIDYRILANGIVAYRQVKIGFLAPYPGVRRTLEALRKKGMKLAIVTDAPRLKAWLRLAAMKLDGLFDAVVAFEDTKRKKPSKLPFRKALSILRLKPEECLMVGDWPERDIKGAKKIGMKSCFARYGAVKKCKDAGSDYEINKIEDILDMAWNVR